MSDNIQIIDATNQPRTMRALESGGIYTPVHAGYDVAGDKGIVGTERTKFRDDFFDYDTVALWEQVHVGSGMTVSVAGAANGSRYLNIASGTTASQETILLSRTAFRLPLKLAFALTLSQRIANCEAYVELVSVDPSTGAVQTDSTFPSVDTSNALNAASWKFDGTVATQAKYLVRADGISDLLSGASSIATTLATGTSPNFIPSNVYSIVAENEQNIFTAQAADSANGVTQSYRRTSNCIDPTQLYKVRLRVKTLASAPASSTDVRIHFIRILDGARLTVDMARAAGRGDIADSLPVQVTTLPTLATVSSVASSQAAIPGAIADVASGALTTTTTTAAIVPTFGTSFEANIPVTAVSGTNPTLDVTIQESDDTGTNWFTVYQFPRITAIGMYRSPKLPLTGNRIRYVQTVGGTTPSFTRAINRLQASDSVPMLRQLIDRTIAPATLNSTTASLDVRQCRNVQLVVNLGAATSAPSFQIEGSDDEGASWYAIGSPLAGVANASVRATVNNVAAALVRARVSTAGTGVTLGYALLKGF